MFFRNLTLFRFAHTIDSIDLETGLKGLWLRQPGPAELETVGFVRLLHEDDQVLRWCGNAALFCVGYRTRLLPSVVVAEHLAKRVRDVTEKQGRRVGAKERKQIKEDVVSTLLPQAFVKPARVYAYIDVKDGWLVIDTASRSIAEEVVGQLRMALSRFPCTPLTPEDSPRTVMTDWLIHNKLPADVAFGDEIDLRDPAEGGSKWNGRATDLETDEVREHLKSGMQVWRLGLSYAERVSFVLGEDMVVRKMRFHDSALEELDDAPENAQAELDARFALMRLELERLFSVLCAAFRIPREAKLTLDGGDAPKDMRDAIGDAAAEQEEDLKKAAEHVRAIGRASISSLQRRMQIGYNRAARLIEALEARGIVSAPDSGGARKILKESLDA